VVEVPFEANFAIDDAWNGRGSFKCGWTQAENVPVRTAPR
jgi:hypothetical protein